MIFTSDLLTQTQKFVLIEEGTGTWCQYCPRGEAYGRYLQAEYDNVLFVAIHNGDPMEDEFYAENINFTGIPNGHIDRKFIEIDPAAWESPVMQQLALTPPAGISVTTTFDEITREMSMTIKADFEENLNGDYRLAAIVVEDGVTGPAPAYDQTNAYSGGGEGPMFGYENLPNPIPASTIVYNHVGRHLAGGVNGDENSLPASISNSESHSYTYNLTLPDEYNEDYIHVIGLLINNDNGQILNAGKSAYLPGYTNGKPFFHSAPKEQGFVDLNYKYEILTHDPEHDDLTITDDGNLPSWLTLTDLGNGMAVLEGIPPALDAHQIELIVSDGDWEILQTFELVINEAQEDWIQIGVPRFSNGGADKTAIEISSQGIPFVMTANFDTDLLYIYKFENDSWSQVGPSLSVDPFHVAFALSPDDVPYVYSGMKVTKLDGGSWEQVGGLITDGVFPDIIVGDNGVVYTVVFPFGGSAAHKLNGNMWESMPMPTDGNAVWNRLKIDNNGNPMLIYGTDGQSIAFSEVTQWDGSQWNLLGGGYVEPNAQTYFDHDVAMGPGGVVYAALTIGVGVQHLNIYKIENGTWTLLAENLTGGATESCNLAVDAEGNLIVAFRDENSGGRTSVMRFDGNEWKYMGLPGFSNIASNQELALNNEGIPLVVYSDDGFSGKASVKQYLDLTIGSFTPSVSQQKLKIYPNPNNGIFTLEYEKGSVYQIIDFSGRIVHSGSLESYIHSGNSTKEINTNVLNSGVYILKVIENNGIQTIKFLVEK